MTADQSLAFVQTNQTSILIGAALCTFFWSFWVTWAAPIVLYIRRMERAPVLTIASIANVGGGAAVITTIAVSWTVMAYRRSEEGRVGEECVSRCRSRRSQDHKKKKKKRRSKYT